VAGGEEGIDGWLRFKFSNNSSQRRPVVVNLRFLHASLSRFITEEVENPLEQLGVAGHVTERPALAVREKILPSDGHFGHCGLDVVRPSKEV
jgi:hypothetical protein